jgi:hypothetical protein
MCITANRHLLRPFSIESCNLLQAWGYDFATSLHLVMRSAKLSLYCRLASLYCQLACTSWTQLLPAVIAEPSGTVDLSWHVMQLPKVVRQLPDTIV